VLTEAVPVEAGPCTAGLAESAGDEKAGAVTADKEKAERAMMTGDKAAEKWTMLWAKGRSFGGEQKWEYQVAKKLAKVTDRPLTGIAIAPRCLLNYKYAQYGRFRPGMGIGLPKG